MKKRVLIVLLCFVGALSSAFAAEKKVQGVVISSEDNLPLIGASVYVTAEDLKKAGSAQTTMGVITDVDGQFSIAIPAGITRFFCSYVGYDVLEVKLVPGKEHYEITLHASSQMLDAVVVTGYQTVERRKLTAAVSKLDISDETIGAVKSIDQALAGQISQITGNQLKYIVIIGIICQKIRYSRQKAIGERAVIHRFHNLIRAYTELLKEIRRYIFRSQTFQYIRQKHFAQYSTTTLIPQDVTSCPDILYNDFPIIKT